MLIDPQGPFYGDRISACSDEAQLHFPRLMAASNGFGRLELSISKLHGTVYANFKVKPSKDQIQGWIKEFHANFLLFIYRAENGSTWGQWSVSKGKLPKYKTALDNQSPAPSEAEFTAFLRSYVELKKQRYASEKDYIDISEDFRNVPKPSEDFQTFSHGEVVGEVVGVVGGEVEEEGKTKPPVKFDHSMVAQGVLMELCVSGEKLTRNISEVAKAEIRAGADGLGLMKQMADSGRQYLKAKADGKFEFPPGLERFFGEGLWRDEKLWPWRGNERNVGNGRGTSGVGAISSYLASVDPSSRGEASEALNRDIENIFGKPRKV